MDASSFDTVALPLKVLVACEFSGAVREAFAIRGHDAYSCDILDCERPNSKHIKGDVRAILNDGWDLMIAHPPCTYLTVANAGNIKNGCKKYTAEEAKVLQADALEFVRTLLDAPIEHIALENPISIISSRIRKPDQIIQPWQFGHGEVKATCLWLKNLPPLVPTNVVEGRHPACWLASPGPDRWKIRSRTYQGIADAMAEQWGELECATV